MIDTGLGSLTLKKPMMPIKMEGIRELDTTTTGANGEANVSFLSVVNDLAQAFKFLPKYDQMNYQYSYTTLNDDPKIKSQYESALSEFDWSGENVFGDYSKQVDPSGATDPGGISRSWGEHVGEAYKNMTFQAGASDWNLVDTVNADDSSILDDINAYFSSDWENIKSAGAGKSYYEFARGGVGASSDQEAFDMMASMLESRERVFNVFRNMFGEASELTSNEAVQAKFTAWMSKYVDVDPHNIAILSMFFGMHTDFINTLDAYVNCETYWGGDLVNKTPASEMGTFGADLIAKVQGYISGIVDMPKHDAAQRLLDKWLNRTERWDKVGDKFTGELATAKDEENWVKYFQTEIRKYIDQDIMRVIVGNIFNRSRDKEYKIKKADYDNKKEDMQLEEISQQKMMAKNRAESKKNMVKAKRSSPIAKASKGRKPAISTQPVAPKPSRIATPQFASSRFSGVSKNLAVAAQPLVKSSPAAAPKQASKKNEKKVI